MHNKFYGNIQQTTHTDDFSLYIEEISIKGFTVIPDLLSDSELSKWRQKIDDIYAEQEAQFGREALISIQELDSCRAPLLYDFDFIELAAHSKITSIVERILGEWHILNLQNAIINRPGTEHHQSTWHRDLPYQNFVISKPLAINAIWAIDDFSSETGGTHLLPYSHKNEILPSNEYIAGNEIISTISAGSVIMFDSMMLHRAGHNTSSIIRRAINQLYTIPIIKQQYDFPLALSNMKDKLDANIERLLGFTSQVPRDDLAWRLARKARFDKEI